MKCASRRNRQRRDAGATPPGRLALVPSFYTRRWIRPTMCCYARACARQYMTRAREEENTMGGAGTRKGSGVKEEVVEEPSIWEREEIGVCVRAFDFFLVRQQRHSRRTLCRTNMLLDDFFPLPSRFVHLCPVGHRRDLVPILWLSIIHDKLSSNDAILHYYALLRKAGRYVNRGYSSFINNFYILDHLTTWPYHYSILSLNISFISH